MANYGLLNNIATGLREALVTKQTLSNMENDKKKADQMMRLQAKSHGLIEDKDPFTGEVDYRTDPEWQKHQLELRKATAAPFAFMDPGTRKAQEKLGTEAGEYEAQGGDASVDANLALLRKAKAKLEEEGELGGGVSGLLPDRFQDIVNPDVASTRDLVRSGVAGTVKQLYPGAVSDYESKSTFERAFNPRFKDDVNAGSIQAEIDRLEKVRANKKASFGKFSPSKGGATSGGLVGKPLPQSQESSGPRAGDTEDGYEFLGGDPANPKSWRKK